MTKEFLPINSRSLSLQFTHMNKSIFSSTIICQNGNKIRQKKQLNVLLHTYGIILTFKKNCVYSVNSGHNTSLHLISRMIPMCITELQSLSSNICIVYTRKLENKKAALGNLVLAVPLEES